VSCEHSGAQSGATVYVRRAGWLRLVLVCDHCGAIVSELSTLNYEPDPALPAPAPGHTARPAAGQSPPVA
jgi:hypothetical protein